MAQVILLKVFKGQHFLKGFYLLKSYYTKQMLVKRQTTVIFSVFIQATPRFDA